MRKQNLDRKTTTQQKNGFDNPSLIIINTLSFSGGLFLAALMIDIYRKTIIPWQFPFFTALIIGFCLAFITKDSDFITKSYPSNRILYAIFYYTVAVGFSLTYLILVLNFHLAYLKTTLYNFPIKEKSSMPGPKGRRNERIPLVVFNYFGEEKELVFKYSQTEEVSGSTGVSVVIQKGRVGFDVISSQGLLK